MTRSKANEILFLWKVGAELYPRNVINQALYTTGDLDVSSLEADARLVRVPSVPTWVEGTSLALSEGTSQRASVNLLETAGASNKGNAA